MVSGLECVPVGKRGGLTLSVVVEVEKLVTPLGHDADGILEEGNDDEESTDGWEVTVGWIRG